MLRISPLFFLLIIPLFSCQNLSSELPGKGAEDLWGERVRLNREISNGKPLVIVPFSTSNCGYCMIDGFFSEKNYIGNNERFGGAGFHMALFNPQLDIYAFQKHFGWTSQILTYPPALHEYHQDGFPTLLAFKNGEQVLREYYNYAKFDSLSGLVWDSTARLIPTGELHMATRLIYENRSKEAVCLLHDTSEIQEDERAFSTQYDAYSFSTFRTISDTDRKKHLYIRSGADLIELMAFFGEQDIPLNLEPKAFVIGRYRFPTDTTAFYGCFPNPFNREKYILLVISGGGPKLFWPSNYLDYIVFSGDRPDKGKRLLYGHFNQSDPQGWRFSEERSFSDIPRQEFCISRCEGTTPQLVASLPTPENKVEHHRSGESENWILGNGVCRFPEIATGSDGECWVTWEEDGNIILGRISGAGSVETWHVEHDETDSYNPKLVVSGEEVWVFYLNNRDSYYRLYGRSFAGGRFSGEILVTPVGPNDVVTPEAVAGADGQITVAWCEWLANQRFLKYRIMKNGIRGEIRDVLVVPPLYTKGYTNGWWPSLTSFHGQIWGAWNQHYPATCGVYGGALADSALTITQPSEAMDDREEGGYPDLFTDGEEIFAVWEGSGWDVFYQNVVQPIKIAKFDRETGRWTPGRILTSDYMTTLNQSASGACDSFGNKYIVWSGRSLKSADPWGIYLSSELKGVWSDPVLISEGDETARYPKIVIGNNNKAWISWHTGTGTEMKVKVKIMELD